MGAPKLTWDPNAKIMRKMTWSNTMLDQSRPRSTTGWVWQVSDWSDKQYQGTNTGYNRWNVECVRNLCISGRIQELIRKLRYYHWHIIGLPEVRWTSIGETSAENLVLWRREAKSSWGDIHCQERDFSGILSLCLSAKPKNMAIIQVYSPTSNHEDEEVKRFYESIDSTIVEIPKKDIIIVQGGWNAKVGSKAYENWAGTVGRFGMGRQTTGAFDCWSLPEVTTSPWPTFYSSIAKGDGPSWVVTFVSSVGYKSVISDL